jgi:dolichol kinase
MKELPRRAWHIFGGLSLAIAGLLVPEDIFLPVLISATVAFLIFELSRPKLPPVNRRFLTLFHPLLREKEASTPTGTAYLLLGAVLVFVLYEESIAVMAMTFVAVGDPIAGMVGERWGEPKTRGKSLVGSGACFLSCLLAGAILSTISHVAISLVVIGAFCATLIEFPSLRINDNLTIPLVSGGAMMLVKLALGG